MKEDIRCLFWWAIVTALFLVAIAFVVAIEGDRIRAIEHQIAVSRSAPKVGVKE